MLGKCGDCSKDYTKVLVDWVHQFGVFRCERSRHTHRHLLLLWCITFIRRFVRRKRSFYYCLHWHPLQNGFKLTVVFSLFQQFPNWTNLLYERIANLSLNHDGIIWMQFTKHLHFGRWDLFSFQQTSPDREWSWTNELAEWFHNDGNVTSMHWMQLEWLNRTCFVDIQPLELLIEWFSYFSFSLFSRLCELKVSKNVKIELRRRRQMKLTH